MSEGPEKKCFSRITGLQEEEEEEEETNSDNEEEEGKQVDIESSDTDSEIFEDAPQELRIQNISAKKEEEKEDYTQDSINNSYFDDEIVQENLQKQNAREIYRPSLDLKPTEQIDDRAEDSAPPSSPEAVWEPPISFTPTPRRNSESPSRDIPVLSSQNQPTEYQSWNPEQSRYNDYQGQALKGISLNDTSTLGDQLAPPPIPERTYRSRVIPQSLSLSNLDSDFCEFVSPSKDNANTLSRKPEMRPDLHGNLPSMYQRPSENCISLLPLASENSNFPYTLGFTSHGEPFLNLSCPQPEQNVTCLGTEAWKEGMSIMQQIIPLRGQQDLDKLGKKQTPSSQARSCKKQKGKTVTLNLDDKDPHARSPGVAALACNTRPKKKTKETRQRLKLKAEDGISERKLASPKKTPKYLFLCVSNLNSTTSEETLSYFLESGVSDANIDINNVVYDENRTFAVVQFSSPVDFTEIQNKCMRRKLEGKSITVSKIDPLKYVIVSANSSITEAALKTYFQSPESYGGEVQRVAVCKDGCYKVKFRHEEDVVKVCCKLKHEVSNTTLIVTPMFFTEEAEWGIYDASRHFVPLPSYFLLSEVDKHFQTFLRQSTSVLEELNTCLSPKFAKVVISDEIKVECTLSQKNPKAREIVKVWETEAKKMVYKCINKIIYKSEIIVTEDAWSEVENITSQQKLDTDTILTIYEKMNLKILFVGEKTSVQSFHTAISEQHEEIEHQILRKKRVKTEEIYYSVSKVKLLKKSGIIEEINKITDDLKVELDYRNGKILCTGVNEDILQARNSK